MSYCVNCGVELADSEKNCPLCGVEVLNPVRPWIEPAHRPYPGHVEGLDKRIDSRYVAAFISLLMLIPLMVTMFCNVIADGRLSWSAYVAGAEALLFVWILLPQLWRRSNVLVCILMDATAAALYLWMIEWLTEGEWFLLLGLPLVLVAGTFALMIALVLSIKKRLSVLKKTSVVLFATGLLVVLTELVIKTYLWGSAVPSWSVYTLVPCIILGICALLMDSRANLKEEIRRRFFI
ncbi:MAG: hypothetical protein RR232_00105 [Clostridia bacterium]